MAYSFIDTLFANGDDMDPSPFWVLMALCWFVNEKQATGTTGACWPSIKKIAAKAHVSELTARKWIKVLMEKKLITAHQPPGKVRVFYVDFSRIKELAGGKDLEGVKDASGVKDLEGGPLKMLKGRGERSLPPPLKDLEAEQGNNKEENKERNRESSMRTSGNSSAIASAASAQAQTLPTSFPQSSNSQNHSETKTAGKDSPPNPSERSVAAHRDRLDAPDEQTLQNGTRRSQNASTCISVACLENETPPMSDEDLENLFADAQLEERTPLEKGVRTPLEKGDHLFSGKEEKGTHPSEQRTERPKKKRTSIARPDSVSEQVWNDFSALRTKRRAPITETALKGIQREAEKAGITLEEALSTCCERGWQGFKAEWYRREKLEQKNASKAEYQLPSNDDWDNYDASHYA